MPESEIRLKTCTICRRSLPLDRYYKRANRPFGDGWPRCKECSALRRREYRVRARQIKARQRESLA